MYWNAVEDLGGLESTMSEEWGEERSDEWKVVS